MKIVRNFDEQGRLIIRWVEHNKISLCQLILTEIAVITRIEFKLNIKLHLIVLSIIQKVVEDTTFCLT